MIASDTILKTEALDVGYQTGNSQKTVLENLNLEVKQGALTCFMGPNGVGKSTLLRTLCGAQLPLMGKVLIHGEELKNLSKIDIASNISVVLTDALNAGAMTVKELVSMGRYPYQSWMLQLTNDDKEAVELAMAQTSITELAPVRLSELSDGQRQKVMIARALCQETPVIILDEPTAHLDLNNRVEVINLLKQLARDSNKAVLMATHELDLALQAADELWIVGFDKRLIKGFPEDLVLSGRIDKVFNLKGFDLKTGYLEKQVTNQSINVIGEGYLYLWTKNALERNGFGVSPTAEKTIKVIHKEGKPFWKNETGALFSSLEKVIKALKTTN